MSEKAQVQELAEVVRRADGVDLKLDWDHMGDADQVGDFCCFLGGRLVGYAQIDGNDREPEVTAATLPEFRRRGVFRALLGRVRAEVLARGAESLLLVCYKASQSGTAAAQALGLSYTSSEYRMEAAAAALPPLSVGPPRLVPVDPSNLAALARLTAQSFGGGGTSSEMLARRLQQEGVRYFLAEADGAQIGQIGVVDTGGSIYVRGVGILPEYRRRGYGRQLLAAAVRLMLAEGHAHFALDVATDNPQALTLYQSCGFRETMGMTTTMSPCDLFADEAFAALVQEAQSCRACPRMEGRRRVLSPANGPLSAKILFIAEAPGRLGGDKGGVPLTGDASGRNFLRYLSAAGLKREDVFVTNAALCNPRTERGTNAPPSAAELRACSSFLSRTLDVVQPQVVATLGSKALAALHLIAPHPYTLRDHAATAVAWNSRVLFPLYHPSPQVVISPTGRSHAAQEADYVLLGRLLQEMPTPGSA